MKTTITAALCLGLLALAPVGASAASEPMAGTVVDQSSLQATTGDRAYFGQYGTHVKDTAFQTFTAGMDGTLAQIALRLWGRSQAVGTMEVRFYEHGLLGGNSPADYPEAAAVRTLSFAALGKEPTLDVTYFDFSDAGIRLESGGVYSFLVVNSSPYLAPVHGTLFEGGLIGAGVNTYAGGDLYKAPNWGLGYQPAPRRLDLDFVTRIFADEVAAVPEPTSWAMLIVGLGAVGVTLRRRPHAGVQAV